ncbi:MAG TPA: A/G-specific adenine glycosylase [Chloroflexota bacterium]|nr:A/G-specific adenine glycosylase [Chloroflexota bacterium]
MDALYGDLHATVLRWYAEWGRDLPWRHTRDPYRVLVSEVMLQQTQVDRVLPKYAEFLTRFPTIADLAAAPVAEVIRAWKGLGYNLRAIRLHRIAQQVVARHEGELPNTASGLLALEGIGPYTAGAVACFAFGLPEPVLDTNVRRVLGRIVIGPDGPTAPAGTLWTIARQLLPEHAAYDWNQALMDIGARICLPRRPQCLLCPAQPWCRSAGKVTVAVRERSASYTAAPQTPFAGSSRYYRGRVVDHLRTLVPGASVSLEELALAIKPDSADDDLPWLREMVGALARDGLAEIGEDGRVRLP